MNQEIVQGVIFTEELTQSIVSKQNITVVLGASPNPVRFSCKAVKSLMKRGKKVVAVGFREEPIIYEGEDHATKILIRKGMPHIEDVDTVSIYIGSSRQEPYYDYVFSLNPRRVIFNPGTVNPAFMGQLSIKGIEVLNECMLVMLREGNY